MEDDTILLIAAAGIGIYALNKSGIFEATKSLAGGIDGVSQGAGTIGREIGETFAAASDPFQAASKQLTDAINRLGKDNRAPGFYSGSRTGTVEISPSQLQNVLKTSGVSTMAQVSRDVKNVNGTLVSPLFVGGSYTPTSSTTQPLVSAVKPTNNTSPSRTSSNSNRTLAQRVGGGYTTVGAKNIKLR